MHTTKIDCSVIEAFEGKIDANLRITQDHLQKHCPTGDSKCFKIILDKDDIERIFLCYTPNFSNFTDGDTFRLKDINENAKSDSVVIDLVRDNIDLSKADDFSPIFISTNLEIGSLVTFDGNHRLMAHFLAHRTVDGVHAFLYVHHNAKAWCWFHDDAKKYGE